MSYGFVEVLAKSSGISKKVEICGWIKSFLRRQKTVLTNSNVTVLISLKESVGVEN